MSGIEDANHAFRELAIAGGPPHRDALLEPAMPEAALADVDAYGQVLEEIARGITMVTHHQVVMSRTPGWIGVQCDSVDMATWVMRAIIVENVLARREHDVLYLPAGPHFKLGGEIRSIVTVCAETFHYWDEHIAALNDHHDE